MKSQKPTTSLDSAGRIVLNLRRALVTAAVLTSAIGMSGLGRRLRRRPLARSQLPRAQPRPRV